MDSLLVMSKALPLLLEGIRLTIILTLLAVVIGTVIGLFVSLARLSGIGLLKYLAVAYTEFFRGTPLLVQLFMIYFGLPQILGTSLDPFSVAVFAFSLNSGAYVAEIFRAGIQSIDRGQMEAARSLGMTSGQAMRYIILPQAFKRAIPPLGNEFIALMKDTSLVSVIGLAELTRKGQLIIATNYKAIQIWTEVAVFYLVMTLLISHFFVNRMERRLKTGDHS